MTELAEIKLRATVRIGELSRALEIAKGAGRGKGKEVPSGGHFKRDALKAAGISHASAQRAEQLAEPALALAAAGAPLLPGAVDVTDSVNRVELAAAWWVCEPSPVRWWATVEAEYRQLLAGGLT